MANSKSAASPLKLGRPDDSSPLSRMLQGVHEEFANALSTELGTFLQSEIRAELAQISFMTMGDFLNSLRAPACLIRMRLLPREDCMVLHLSPAAVFALLERLLGGGGEPGEAERRGLTEIEWSLLEEVVRVIVRALGESWQAFHTVEFKVESLESNPAMMAAGDPGATLVRIRLALTAGETTGELAVAVPEKFFEVAAPPAPAKEAPQIAPPEEDVRRNLALLEDATVDLEVTLDGPTLAFRELMALEAGQVVRFNYPLRKPVQALVNGEIAISGHVVSAGRKRAFQIEQLPG